jgi:hypothetical protein
MQDMDTQPITFRIPIDLYERLRRVAFELRVPMSSIVLEGTEERVARLETEAKRKAGQ